MKVDVLVIGAGPAGLAAARETAQAGLRTLILDEFLSPGGRLLGQFHRESSGGYWVGQNIAAQMVEDAHRAGVEMEMQTSVYGIVRSGSQWCVMSSKGRYSAPQLLLATGATEVPAPVPGWTLPGVFSIGATQVMTNVHFVKPGTTGVVAGVNVLSLAITAELRMAGVDIKAVVLPAEGPTTKGTVPAERLRFISQMARLAPSLPLRLGARMAGWAPELSARLYPRGGVRVFGAPLQLRTRIVSIEGTSAVRVTLAHIGPDGRELSRFQESVDFVAIAGGLAPLVELAALADCPLDYVDELGGYIPVHNERLQTPLYGLYLAGNITGIESAMVAISQGRLAGKSMLCDLGACTEADVNSAQDGVRAARQGAPIQFHPRIEDARKRMYAAPLRSAAVDALNDEEHTTTGGIRRA